MTVRLPFDLVSVVLAAWFWPHCARPWLTWQRAGRITYGLVLAVTILTVAVYAGELLADLAGLDASGGTPRWWIGAVVGFLWIAVVGVGFGDHYSALVRLTRRR